MGFFGGTGDGASARRQAVQARKGSMSALLLLAFLMKLDLDANRLAVGNVLPSQRF